MKGYLAMQKMDLISDEYVREAEIDEATAVVVSEKRGFWKGFARFMNSPVGVAMLCAVVSLSVLAVIVMAGTGKWGEGFSPAGSLAEGESEQTTSENVPPPPEDSDFTITYSKDHVAEFYQALKDKDMIGKIPNPAVTGEVKPSDDPIYLIEEEDIFNVTPTEIYEKTGAMIFDARMMVYLWMDDEIYILNEFVVFGSGFISAVLCDYDQSGTEDIFCTYITSMSGVWYTHGVVFDVAEKALRHNLQRIPSDGSLSSAIIGLRICNEDGFIQKRITNGKAYYDIYQAERKQEGSMLIYTLGELYATYMPTPEGLVYLKPGATEVETSPPPPITDIPELVPVTLSQYFEEYGFVGGLSEGDFIHGVLGKFSYEGQPLNEMPIVSGSGELPDGGFTGTAFYEGECKDFDFSHSTQFPTNNDDSYSYSLTTQVPLEGFALPCDMAFDMTFAEAYEKLGLGDMKNYGVGDTILYRVGNETLTLSKKLADPETLADIYTIKLTFTETATEGEGTRSIVISFGEDQTLCEIKISVSTKGNASFEKLATHVTDAEIKEVFFHTMIPEPAREYFTPKDLTVRYYGIFNNGHIIFVDGILDYTEAFEYENIFGYIFEYPTSQKMLYYKGGRFYSLPEAVEAGHLTKADIERLYTILH